MKAISDDDITTVASRDSDLIVDQRKTTVLWSQKLRDAFGPEFQDHRSSDGILESLSWASRGAERVNILLKTKRSHLIKQNGISMYKRTLTIYEIYFLNL